MKTKWDLVWLDLKIMSARYSYGRAGVTQESRHRMTKEIAQELKQQMGNGAYLYCLERLSNDTAQPKLWRDVLSWLDEGVGDEVGIGGGTDKSRQGSEREKLEASDSSTVNQGAWGERTSDRIE